MKNFFKKIAFVLALAMVLGNVAPAMTASAATAPGLKYASKVIYVGGGDALGLYSDNCWTPSQNNANYNATYATDSKIIDVAKNGKITANGTGVGAAVVTVTYTNKTNAKDVVTAKFTAKVRRNATDVKLTAASVTKLENALKVGDVVELDAAKSVTTPKSYAKGNYGLNNYRAVCNDNLVIVSDDDTIVSVEGRKITAVAVGTAKITVLAYQYGENKATGVKSIDYTVTVAGGLDSVVLKGTNEVDLVFGAPITKDEVNAKTILMTNAAGADISTYIKDVSYSTDMKTVTLTTHVAFVDKAVYKFTIAALETEKTLTASIGEVASIVVTEPSKVTYNEATTLKAKLYDADGIEVALPSNASITYELAEANNNAWVYGDQLTIFGQGVTAAVKAVYHSGKYDTTTYAEITIASAAFPVLSVENAAPVIDKFTAAVVTKNDGSADSHWTGEMRVPASSDNVFALRVKATKSNGDTVISGTYDSGITFESTDVSKLYVNPVTGKLTTIGDAGSVVGVIVTCGDLKTVYSVSIGAKEEIARLEVNKNSVVLTNSTLVEIESNKSIEIKAISNYGNPMTISSYTLDNSSKPTNGDLAVADSLGNVDGVSNAKVVLAFNAQSKVVGTYQYKLTVSGKTVVVSAIVQNGLVNTTGSAVTYRLVSAQETVDTKVTKDTSSIIAKDFNICVVAYNAQGVAVNVITSAAITIKDKDGKVVYAQNVSGEATVAQAGHYDTTNILDVANAKIKVTPLSGTALTAGAYQKMSTGKYTVEATVYVDLNAGVPTTNTVESATNVKRGVASTSFTINNTQVAPTVTVKSVTLKDGATDLATCFEVKNPYGDTVITPLTIVAVAASSGDILTVAGGTVSATKAGSYGVLVKTVTFLETFEGGNTVTHTVTLNRLITYVQQ